MLESELSAIALSDLETRPRREQADILEEVLETVRQIAREQRFQPTQVTSFGLDDAVRKVLTTLTPRQERILRMIHGLGEPAKHLEEVAEQLGLPIEAVEAVYVKSMKALGNPERINLLLESLGRTRLD